ncbi:TIR domain-containing protein, partial [candidate division KSB3 bacterium]|nr:TIR domain-containing protein [candidate division KSB3 bacterium]
GEAAQLPHIHDELILSWFAVKTALEEMQDDYISYNRYRQVCAEQEVDDELSQQTLLGFLHDLGIVLHFHDHPMLEDTNVLNPEWVTRGVYQLLNSNELFQRKGELERRALDRILDPQRYPRAKHPFILDMMRKFELCFDFAEYAGERFLVPDLLAKEEPYTGDWDDSLGFQYHYDILPGSVMSRFIVRMHAYIFKRTYWRRGVVLASTDGKNTALVKADLEERKIYIHVAGRDATRHIFLEIIRADLHKIHRTIPKLKVREKVPIPGHPAIVVDYEHLLTLEELGEEYLIPEGLKAKVSVRQLLHGIQPQPAPGSFREENVETEPHTYFLSYSWKNSEAADHLELALSRQQRPVLRDETSIAAGGRVSTSVEQMIQQADTFVALWSAHYAQSDWCPNELAYARNRQASGQKPSRIVLIALDQTDVPIRFIDTLRLDGQERGQRELAVQRLVQQEAR